MNEEKTLEIKVMDGSGHSNIKGPAGDMLARIKAEMVGTTYPGAKIDPVTGNPVIAEGGRWLRYVDKDTNSSRVISDPDELNGLSNNIIESTSLMLMANVQGGQPPLLK